MPRSYRHIKDYEAELQKLKEEGLSEREIGNKLGFSLKQVHNYFYRYRVNQRKLEAGTVSKQRGRAPKGYVVSKQDKVAELRYILARKEAKIKSLEMENELMRDFLLLIERE